MFSFLLWFCFCCQIQFFNVFSSFFFANAIRGANDVPWFTLYNVHLFWWWWWWRWRQTYTNTHFYTHSILTHSLIHSFNKRVKIKTTNFLCNADVPLKKKRTRRHTNEDEQQQQPSTITTTTTNCRIRNRYSIRKAGTSEINVCTTNSSFEWWQ